MKVDEREAYMRSLEAKIFQLQEANRLQHLAGENGMEGTLRPAPATARAAFAAR